MPSLGPLVGSHHCPTPPQPANCKSGGLDQLISTPLPEVLLQDVTDNDLKDNISDRLNAKYLQPVPLDRVPKLLSVCPGIMYGSGNRWVLSLPVSREGRVPIWIHFLFDSGSPESYLAPQVCGPLQQALTANLCLGLGCIGSRRITGVDKYWPGAPKSRQSGDVSVYIAVL